MVELDAISKRFGPTVAVDAVNLRIQTGEFLTLLGPSGCGKTTLLRIISGFETLTSGRVLLDGQDVTTLAPYRRDVNQVFQSYALFPHLSVRDNIAFGLRMKKVPRAQREQKVREAIETVSLQGLDSRKPSQLSGGQRQRVALARALVCQPRVLLLDEPLAALDAGLRRTMQIELKRLQVRVGVTFVLVTHDQEEALVMSDRIAVMNQGKLEQVGAPSEVYHRPATAFVADFIGQANLLAARITKVQGAQVVLMTESGWQLQLPAARAPLVIGADVILCFRPERVRLAPHHVPGNCSFPARAAQRINRGPVEQLFLEIGPGRSISALLPSSSPSQSFQPGQPVTCHIDPDDIIVLPAPNQNSSASAVCAAPTPEPNCTGFPSDLSTCSTAATNAKAS